MQGYDNYDNSAMSSLMGSDDSDAPVSSPGKSANWPPQSFDSITIRAAKNGVVVDVSRPSKPSSSSGPAEAMKPEKPRLARSPEELSSILDEVMGVDLDQDQDQDQDQDEDQDADQDQSEDQESGSESDEGAESADEDQSQ